MLDNPLRRPQDTQADAEVVEKGLGLGIRFACSVGSNRQIEMTAGVPLDWPGQELNGTLDKLAQAMDRQALRYELHDRKLLLERTERDLETNRTQRTRLEAQYRNEFSSSGRKGEWNPTTSQAKQLDNYANTVEHLTEQVKKIRQDIKDAEEKCR